MVPASARAAGHLGELIQGRLGPSGPIALVTLPCPVLGATARLVPGAFALRDPARLISRRDAEALLAWAVEPACHGAEAESVFGPRDRLDDPSCACAAENPEPHRGEAASDARTRLPAAHSRDPETERSSAAGVPAFGAGAVGVAASTRRVRAVDIFRGEPVVAPAPAGVNDPSLQRRDPGAASDQEAAVHAAREAGCPPRPQLRLRLAADMPPGGGGGASTAVRLAILRAAARAAGAPPPSPEAAARLCLAQEGATDPLMFPDPAARLWASREGRALAPLPPLPRFEVVGGFDGPPLRTDPQDRDFADVSDLAAAWAPAAARADLPALAALATASAERHEGRGRARLAPLHAVARAHGALGLAVAHTGSARALLFAPGAGDPVGAAAALRALGLRGVLRFRAGGRS